MGDLLAMLVLRAEVVLAVVLLVAASGVRAVLAATENGDIHGSLSQGRVL